MPKFLNKPQKGEWPWSRPRWGFPATAAEIKAAENGGLVVGTVTTTTIHKYSDGAPDVTSESVWEYRIGLIPSSMLASGAPKELDVCPDSAIQVRLIANYFGDRADPSFYERYKDVLVPVKPG